jgi:hypothetical protein
MFSQSNGIKKESNRLENVCPTSFEEDDHVLNFIDVASFVSLESTIQTSRKWQKELLLLYRNNPERIEISLKVFKMSEEVS